MLFEVLATPFIVLLSSLDARMETGESDRSERLPSAEEVDDAVERQCGETTDTGSESADDTLDDAKMEELLRKAAAMFSLSAEPTFLPGEEVITRLARTHKRNAALVHTRQRASDDVGELGTLFLTNFRLAFVADERSSYVLPHTGVHSHDQTPGDATIPIQCVAAVYRWFKGRRYDMPNFNKKLPLFDAIEIECKDIRAIRFGLSCARQSEAIVLLRELVRQLGDPRPFRFFAFAYTAAFSSDVPEWITGGMRHMGPVPAAGSIVSRVVLESEMERTGAERRWRISAANASYTVCATYPPYLACPANACDRQLFAMSADQTSGGVPVWSWTQKHTGVSLCRGSLLRSGASVRTPASDVWLEHIKRAQGPSNGACSVTDISAVVPSRTLVRQCYTKLWTLCTGSSLMDEVEDRRWLTNVTNTRWLRCVGACLYASLEVVKRIEDAQVSVIVESNDFQDGVAVVVSLAQIMLDPFYRTTRGFAKLIQKEWVSMGYPFSRRNGHDNGVFTAAAASVAASRQSSRPVSTASQVVSSASFASSPAAASSTPNAVHSASSPLFSSSSLASSTSTTATPAHGPPSRLASAWDVATSLFGRGESSNLDNHRLFFDDVRGYSDASIDNDFEDYILYDGQSDDSGTDDMPGLGASDDRNSNGSSSTGELHWNDHGGYTSSPSVASGSAVSGSYSSEMVAGMAAHDDDESPMFLLFLDCVYQIMVQYPLSFEFTSDFLLFLHEESIAGRHGTFLFNCDRQRDAYALGTRSVSLWSHLEAHLPPPGARAPDPTRLSTSSSHEDTLSDAPLSTQSGPSTSDDPPPLLGPDSDEERAASFVNPWYTIPNAQVLRPVVSVARFVFFAPLFHRWLPRLSYNLLAPCSASFHRQHCDLLSDMQERLLQLRRRHRLLKRIEKQRRLEQHRQCTSTDNGEPT